MYEWQKWEQELDRLSVTALILLACFARMEASPIDSKVCYLMCIYIYTRTCVKSVIHGNLKLFAKSARVVCRSGVADLHLLPQAIAETFNRKMRNSSDSRKLLVTRTICIYSVQHESDEQYCTDWLRSCSIAHQIHVGQNIYIWYLWRTCRTFLVVALCQQLQGSSWQRATAQNVLHPLDKKLQYCSSDSCINKRSYEPLRNHILSSKKITKLTWKMLIYTRWIFNF